MICIVIDADAPPLALAATLSPLVRGVVEGIVGSAMIVSRKDDEDTASIADASGCRLLVSPTFAEGFARAMTYSGGSGALLLSAGIQVGPEFWPVLADNLPVLGHSPAVTKLHNPGLGQRFSALRGIATRDQALLLPPALARQIALEKTDPFAHRYGKTLVTLPAQARRLPIK